MRHPLFALAVFTLLGACGGGPTDATPGSAKSVSVSGDNQTAIPGAALPVAPSVVVRDDNGSPVPDIAVAFSVDSGGGSITTANSRTNANGVASPGNWTLGPIEGPQVLGVLAGSLPKVKIRATAANSVLAQAAIGNTGGTITVNKPGDPLHGTTLIIPAGAFTGSAQVSIRSGGPSLTPRSGARAASAVAIIESKGGTYNRESPATLRLPGTFAAGEVPTILRFDPATGYTSALPTVPVGTTGAETSIMLVNGPATTSSSLLAWQPAHAFSSRMLDDILIRAVIHAVPLSELEKDLDTQYVPAVDDFEIDGLRRVDLNEDYRYINGFGIAAAWYFDKFKSSRGALRNNFSDAPGVEFSNPRAFRLGVILGRQIRQNSGAIINYNIALFRQIEHNSNLTMDSLILLSVKAGIYHTGRPQVITGTSFNSPEDPLVMLLVYRVTGNTMLYTLGTSGPGKEIMPPLVLANRHFPLFRWGPTDPATGVVKPFLMSEYQLTDETASLSAAQLNAEWGKVFDRTIGNGDPFFPSWRLAGREERPIKDTVFVADTTRFWVECPTCLYSLTPAAGVPVQGKMAGGYLLELKNGEWKDVAQVRDEGFAIDGEADDARHFGLVVYEPDEPSTGAWGYLDWTEFVVKARKLVVTPATKTVNPDEDFTLTAEFDRPNPPNRTYEWEMGDGRKLTTTTNTVSTSYPPPPGGGKKDYSVKVTLKTGGVKHAIGKSSVTVGGDPVPFWRILTLSDPGGLLGGLEGAGDEEFRALQRMIQSPASGMFSIEQIGATIELRMRAKQSGVWSANDCCPVPGYNPATEWKLPLGFAPAVSHPVGPFFAGWGTSFWSQSTQELDSGTLTGQYVPRVMQYQIHDQGTQTGPAGGLRFSATRNGNMMTGEIRVHIWLVDVLDTGEVSEEKVFHLPFTAVRIR